MSQLKYALMIWPTDKNLMNVRPLDNIVRPKKLFNDYEVGDECLCVYPGFMPGPDEDGLWRAIILATAGSREELKPVLTRLVNESRPLIPDGFTCEMVTQIMIDLALAKVSMSNQTGEPKEGSAALKNATDTCNKKQTRKKRKNDENQKTQTSKDKDTTENNKQNGKQNNKENLETASKQCKQKTIAKKTPMGEVGTNLKHTEPPASKQRKITKSLEAISQDEAFVQLEKDLSSLETNQKVDSARVPAAESAGCWAAENDHVFEENTFMDIDVNDNVTFSEDVSDALRSSSAILYGAQPIESSGFTGWNEPSPCQGCVSLGNKVEFMRQNFDILWNEVKKLQEMVESEISQRKQICGAASCTQTARLDVVSHPSPPPSASQWSSTALQYSPLKSAQQTNCAAAELDTTEKSSADPNKIYNGYTIEQLEREAQKEKDFSKAAKRLLLLMFTEEERAGRCLVDFKKTYKKTGITVVKKGLADQVKLAALQDIILRCYTVVGGRSEVNRKLIEKLKPSAAKK